MIREFGDRTRPAWVGDGGGVVWCGCKQNKEMNVYHQSQFELELVVDSLVLIRNVLDYLIAVIIARWTGTQRKLMVD